MNLRASMVTLCIVSACSSATLHDGVTAAALRSLCALPLAHTSSPSVVAHTTMIVQLAALQQQFLPGELSLKDVELLTSEEDRLIRGFSPVPVILPRGTQCAWRLKETREPYTDEMLVELSNVVSAGTAGNPTAGVFARISAGGRPGADFYWVPISGEGEAVRAGTPVLLAVADG